MGKFGLDFKDLASIQNRQVAEVFGAGGGQQIKFITDVKYYEMLGLVKEVN